MVPKQPYKFFSIGLALIVIFSLLGIGGFDILIETVLKKVLVLTPFSPIWPIWKTMPLPIYLKFHFFNVMNPEELQAGAKAILREAGPYVYLEDWEKEDITIDDENDTVRYRMTKKYYFQPQLSNGTEEDVMSFINIIYLATVAIAKDYIEDDFMLGQMDEMLAEKGEKLVSQATVRQLLFDGVSVQTYIDLFKNALVRQVAEELGLGLPEIIMDGLFAIFKAKNGTDEGYFVVHNGVKDPLKVNEIISHNGRKILDYWHAPECNKIKGTDATFFHSYLTKDTILEIFSPMICRSLKIDHLRDQITNGVHVSRFRFSPDNFKTPETYPDNACFCPKSKYVNITYPCVLDGVFSVAPCYFGAPLLISNPHFYGADPAILDTVEGLNPDPAKHESFLDFHALTGSPIDVQARFQFGIELANHPGMPTFQDVQNALIPLGWLEEGSTVDGFLLYSLMALDLARAIFVYLAATLVLTGMGIFGYGVYIVRKNKREIGSAKSTGKFQHVES